MLVVQLLFVGTGLLLVALAIPLIRRRVGPNGWYGLRVEATFADEWVWYEANALAGRDLLILGVLQTSLAVALPWLGVRDLPYAIANIVVQLVGPIVMAIAGVRRANALLRQRRT